MRGVPEYALRRAYRQRFWAVVRRRPVEEDSLSVQAPVLLPASAGLH